MRRLARWLKSARSTAFEATWETRFWFVLSIVGVLWRPLRESVPVLFFISTWTAMRESKKERREAEREVANEGADSSV